MNSVYNKDLGVSVITLDYFKQSTGIDLVLEEGNKERAEGKVYSLTSKARDFLFSRKTLETSQIMSYLIYKDKAKKEWEKFAVKYIEATFYYGDESNWKEIPMPIKNAMNTGILSVDRFTNQLRIEVRNTEEDFR
jgi:hypothetical protein